MPKAQHGAACPAEVLQAQHGSVQVDLPRDRYERLEPSLGKPFYVRPTRVRVFTEGVKPTPPTPPAPEASRPPGDPLSAFPA